MMMTSLAVLWSMMFVGKGMTFEGLPESLQQALQAHHGSVPWNQLTYLMGEHVRIKGDRIFLRTGKEEIGFPLSKDALALTSQGRSISVRSALKYPIVLAIEDQSLKTDIPLKDPLRVIAVIAITDPTLQQSKWQEPPADLEEMMEAEGEK